MDCDVSNSAFALLSTLYPPSPNDSSENFLNIAFGYFLGEGPAAMKVPFLDNLARHGAAIDNQGNIRDATPLTISDDQPTQDYINRLSIDPTTDWEEYIKDQEEKTSRQQTFYQLLTGLGLLGLVGAGGYGGQKLARKYLTKENALTVREHAEKIILHPQTLAGADEFFNWIGWGYPSPLPVPILREESEKEVTWKKLHHNIHPDTLTAYLQDPERYETAAGIAQSTAYKYRLLAYYLRHTTQQA